MADSELHTARAPANLGKSLAPRLLLCLRRATSDLANTGELPTRLWTVARGTPQGRSGGKVSEIEEGIGTTAGYQLSPLPTALAHQALAHLDPRSSSYRPAALAYMDPGTARETQRLVLDLRARWRRFLAWQEEQDGCWQLFGRAAGTGPDQCATALAATALLEGTAARTRLARPWLRHLRSLERLGSPVSKSGGSAHRAVPDQFLARAHSLRFLMLTGHPPGSDERRFLARAVELVSCDARKDPRHEAAARRTAPLIHAISGVLALMGLDEERALRESLLLTIGSIWWPVHGSLGNAAAGSCGHPLDESLAALALLNLGATDLAPHQTTLERAMWSLASHLDRLGLDSAEENSVASGQGYPVTTTRLSGVTLLGSAALNAVLAVAALTRGLAALGGVLEPPKAELGAELP